MDLFALKVAGANEDLQHKPIMRVEGACASGGLAFACAVDSITAGNFFCYFLCCLI